MKTKRLPSMSLVVALSAGVAACDSGPGGGTAQRDVYAGPNALQNCIADWGNEELCKQQLSDEEKKKLGGHSPGAHGIFLWGPSYFGANRTVTHKGVTYTPSDPADLGPMAAGGSCIRSRHPCADGNTKRQEGREGW